MENKNFMSLKELEELLDDLGATKMVKIELTRLECAAVQSEFTDVFKTLMLKGDLLSASIAKSLMEKSNTALNNSYMEE